MGNVVSNNVFVQLGLQDESYMGYVGTIPINPWVDKVLFTEYPWIYGEPTDFIGLREEFSKRYQPAFFGREPIYRH